MPYSSFVAMNNTDTSVTESRTMNPKDGQDSQQQQEEEETSSSLPSSSKDDVKINLSTLDGLRCIACLSILLLHTHYFLGALFFPYEESCIQYIYKQLPLYIGSLFFNNSFQMPLFWILSGFLCEYQLDRIFSYTRSNNNNNNIRKLQQYGRFLFNRWLRLYPLYFFFNMVNYIAAINSNEETGASKCDDTAKLIESLFFILKTKPYTATSCAGAGWSVMVDVHGYILITALHCKFTENIRRKYILPMIYTSAIIYMSYSTWTVLNEYDLVSLNDVRTMVSGAAYSLQYQNEQSLALPQYFANNINIRSLWSPDNNIHYWKQIVSFRYQLLDANYFVSVHKNGSSMFLGSLLYLNMKQRQYQQGTMVLSLSNVITKLFMAILLLHITSFCWMFSGLPVYFLVDVIVSITQYSTSKQQHKHRSQQQNVDIGDGGTLTFSTVVQQYDWNYAIANLLDLILNNQLWKKMSPYTYGIYMVHVFVLALSTGTIYKDRAYRMEYHGDDICNDYTLTFIMGTVILTCIISWIAAILLYHTVEWPFRYYRKQYTSTTASMTKTTSVQHQHQKKTN